MKKILLTFFFILLSPLAHAATTWYACSGGGNWSGASVWTSVLADEVGCTASTGNPVAGDTAILNSNSGNITISASAAAATITETGYTGTLAFGTQTLTLSAGGTLLGAMTSTSGTITITGGGITLGGTPTGSFPTLNFTTAGGTLTSGGFTWPGALTLAFAGTYTLSGNWVTSGLTTISAAATLNHTSAETYKANGGYTLSAITGAGTATIILGGGTWTTSTNDYTKNNLTIAGNVTLTGNEGYGTGTLTYSSGTITGGTAVLALWASCTLNTSGMTWPNVNNSTNSSSITITLTSNLNISNQLYNIFNFSTATGYSMVFSGAYNVTTANLTLYGSGGGATQTFTFPAGQTLTVTNSVTIAGTSTTFPMNLASGTASSPFYFNYTGPLSSEFVSVAGFADTYAGAQTIYDLNAATLTRVSGIKAISAANVHPKPINYFTGV